MKKTSSFLFVLLSLLNSQLSGQPSTEIFQSIKKLEVTTTVLYIAAHPDDENTRLITWMSKEKLFRTAYISLTRGDGGQNLIGSELSENLGLIRTRELMAARTIDGGEQFFTRANDFGYSKTSDETLEFWEKEKVLEDLVYVIRKIKPDVIICRFPPDSRAGHGHHSSSAILAKEAFDAASDPKIFPYQVEEFGSWQVKRIYWNTFRFGSNNTTTEQQLKIDAGGYNILDGKSNGEIAAESRSQHKSQGFGVPSQRGTQLEYFSPVAGDTLVTDPFANIPSFWEQSASGKVISSLLQKIIKEYNFQNPSTSIDDLLKARSFIRKMPSSTIQKQKLKEIEKIIKDVIGLWTSAYSYRERYAEQDTIHITFQSILRNYPEATLKVNGAIYSDSSNSFSLTKQLFQSRKMVLAGSPTNSQPYWLIENHPIGVFTIPDKREIGKPWNDVPMFVSAELYIKNDTLLLQIPVLYKETDPVRGELIHPLIISPILTGNLSENKSIFLNDQPKTYELLLQYWGATDTSITINSTISNDEWKSSFKDTTINFKANSTPTTIRFSIQAKGVNTTNGTTSFSFKTGNEKWNNLQGNTSINYNHIPRITWFPTLQIDLQKVDIKIGSKNILYIKGAGDEVASSLRKIGFKVDEVNAIALHSMDLKKYDAIITGIRAYNTDEELANLVQPLFKYMEDGGTFIVQYNTNSNLHPSTFKTPYPFTIGRNRVTDELAKVTFTQPNDPIFNSPNKLTEKDFEGWVQERGLYFASKIDSNYTNLILMNDKDDSPQEGSLIRCQYGKGKYIYTGISFFRQLPAGVPGAYKLFANMIGQKK
ncbi:MAG: PIG-L family deacetylase [Bacteroidetes bacterium]|nr:PIG-L family deacetylase [Bacteroidota bacterium]